MQVWLARLVYGNQSTTGGIDQFWLGRGGLRISAAEQAEWMRKLHRGDYKVSPETLTSLDQLMLLKEDASYELRGKTGTGPLGNGRQIGLLTGVLEVKGSKYFYSMNLESKPSKVWSREKRVAKFQRMMRSLQLIAPH